jgi:type III pantothenate kinase
VLLAIDLGNTNLTFGLFEGDQLRHDWRLATRRDSMPDELGLLMVQLMRQQGFEPGVVDAVVVASVVPPLNSSLVAAIERYFHREPTMVGPGIKTGLKIHYRDPKEVGADRIVAAMAAFKKYGGPLIIVDFGTATTYDVVSTEGDYLGGAIAPGMGISVEALYERAARLQRVELKAPPAVIGRTTVESMQAGIIFGYTAQVEGMVARIRKELGTNARVIATGGYAGLIAAETPVIEHVDQRLMLEGLRLIHEMNPDGLGRPGDGRSTL